MMKSASENNRERRPQTGRGFKFCNSSFQVCELSHRQRTNEILISFCILRLCNQTFCTMHAGSPQALISHSGFTEDSTGTTPAKMKRRKICFSNQHIFDDIETSACCSGATDDPMCFDAWPSYRN